MLQGSPRDLDVGQKCGLSNKTQERNFWEKIATDSPSQLEIFWLICNESKHNNRSTNTNRKPIGNMLMKLIIRSCMCGFFFFFSDKKNYISKEYSLTNLSLVDGRKKGKTHDGYPIVYCEPMAGLKVEIPDIQFLHLFYSHYTFKLPRQDISHPLNDRKRKICLWKKLYLFLDDERFKQFHRQIMIKDCKWNHDPYLNCNFPSIMKQNTFSEEKQGFLIGMQMYLASDTNRELLERGVSTQ